MRLTATRHVHMQVLALQHAAVLAVAACAAAHAAVQAPVAGGDLGDSERGGGGEEVRASATRRTSHVTRHTSHVTRHTSHVTRHTSPEPRGLWLSAAKIRRALSRETRLLFAVGVKSWMHLVFLV